MAAAAVEEDRVEVVDREGVEVRAERDHGNLSLVQCTERLRETSATA